jgi:hypothetical protein
MMIPANQASAVPPGWIDIPGCFLGTPDDYQTYLANGGCLQNPPVVAPVPPGVVTSLPTVPPPALTPHNIVQPLPDIQAAVMPAQAPCSQWQALNGWIAQNPMWAVMILGIVTRLAWPKGR